MKDDSFGLSMIKREGWAFCPQCEATAPSGEDIEHQDWCTPYKPPSRWERFVKRLDVLRFWEKGSWHVHPRALAALAWVTLPLIMWGSWELWRIFINYMVECPCK